MYETIDEVHRDKPAATRRQMVAGATAALGSMGMLAWADRAEAQSGLPMSRRNDAPNTPENIVNVAATAEVLATILNTLGLERVQLSPLERREIQAASFEELLHYRTLVSDAVGATPATKRIWIPDAYLASHDGFFTALAVGDQVFVNAYLLAGTVFARAGGLSGSRFARFAAEFMGAEAVHRGVALRALGGIANDRAFMKFTQREPRPGLPTTGEPGFSLITGAVEQLQSAGFGFGQPGSMPGQFYDFDEVSKRTPEPGFVNTRSLA